MIDRFESLFGIKERDIRKTCILAPFMTRGFLKSLGIEKLNRGNPYAGANTNDFTVIHTRISAPFLGDAVLQLEQSPCRYLIFIGACGAVRKTSRIDIGTVIIPQRSYAMDSFSDLLAGRKVFNSWPADNDLLDQMQSVMPEGNVSQGICASLGSIFLEGQCQRMLQDNRVDVVDMECAAFFHAAAHIGKKGVAVLYVTDIINEKPVFAKPPAEDHARIQAAVQTIQGAVLKIAGRLNKF